MAYLNGKKVNNSQLINQDLCNLYESAGVDINTKQPTQAKVDKPMGFKYANKRLLRINDEQVAINSIKWFNLPYGIDENLIERILYYRGQGMLFYLESADKFMFLPYALGSKGIDMYGRFINVTPLPFNGSTSDEDDVVEPWIKGLEFDVIYDMPKADHELTKEDLTDKCILISDYSKQYSQTNISRQILNEPLLEFESNFLPLAKTALANSTGVQGMRVQSSDEYSNVLAANKLVDAAAISGSRFIPVIGSTEFQDMASGKNVATADQFLMTMQSVDNYRLTLHGVDSGGIFQKQAHMLESENEMNAGKSSFVMQDRISNRQHACDLANAWWGLGIWADVSEPALGMDKDLDGDMYDDREANPSSSNEEEATDGSISE